MVFTKLFANVSSTGARLLTKKHLSLTMGGLGATVAGTDPCSTGGHPNFQLEKKGDSK